MAAMRKLMHPNAELFRLLHNEMHKQRANRKLMKGNQIIVLTVERDRRIVQKGRGRRKPQEQQH